MQNTEKIRDQILKARETRALLRSEKSSNYNFSISLSLNIAGYPKVDETINHFFEIALDEFKTYMLSQRILIDEKNEHKIIDEAGNFYLAGIHSTNYSGIQIKKITEKFEQKHRLGRLTDIDLSDKNNNYISSGKLKTCYVCGEKSAISCMRNKAHSYAEIRSKLFFEIKNYLKNKQKDIIIRKVSSLALKALLYEVSLSPKPGLVDYFSSGSHRDMNYFTFIDSSTAISQYFTQFAELGFNFSGSANEVLPAVREIGLNAEKAMYKSTGNVNTQKGIIFLMGLSIFTATNILANTAFFSKSLFRKKIKEICKNIVDNELKNSDVENLTHGEKMFKKYGNTGAGARMEVQSGFSTIFNSVLPYFENHLKKDSNPDSEDFMFIMRQGLLKIMSINNDSNILYRGGFDKLKEIKRLSEMAFRNNDQYKQLNNYCNKHKLSPGGSADLLSVSLFIHFLKYEF